MPVGPSKYSEQQRSTAARRTSPSALRTDADARQRAADVPPPASKPGVTRGDPGDSQIGNKARR